MSVIPFPVPTFPVKEEDTSKLAVAGRHVCAFLAHHVGRPVTRTDRPLSVTASIEVSDHRFGISASIASSLRKRTFGEDLAEWRARRDAAPRELAIDIHAAEEWLRDGSLATVGIFGREYADPVFASVKDAIAWVEKYCRIAPVERLTRAEEDAWKRHTVVIPDGEDPEKRKAIPLVMAVNIHGERYRERISAAVLMAVHGMSEVDAKVVEAAVRKYLPQRRR